MTTPAVTPPANMDFEQMAQRMRKLNLIREPRPTLRLCPPPVSISNRWHSKTRRTPNKRSLRRGMSLKTARIVRE